MDEHLYPCQTGGELHFRYDFWGGVILLLFRYVWKRLGRLAGFVVDGVLFP